MPNFKWLKHPSVFLIVLVGGLILFYSIIGGSPGNSPGYIPISKVLKDASAVPSLIKEIDIVDDSSAVVVIYKDLTKVLSRREAATTDFTTQLKNAGYDFTKSDVAIVISEPSQFGGIFQLALFLLPTLLFIGLLVFMMRQSQGGNSQVLGFGKSHARKFEGAKTSVTFAEVAGVEESKQELAEIVEFLKFPDKFTALGAKIPKGVLLVGPPGTGKTMLSKAVAGEAGVPFFSISGSEFVEMFVGVGASRVRDLFAKAKLSSPCIIFIDEIDAVGRQRGAGMGGGNDEREQTLNQILVEMDGFDTGTNVIVLAATNRADVLDPALLRPGRFDRQVFFNLPDTGGRKAILGVHIKGKPLAEDVVIETLAKQTPGFSGADLANMVNEGAILAARRNRKTISMSEMEEAIMRVMAGPERKSHLVPEMERLITAYHEVGHALVARMLPNVDPVHKISIIPRGMTGGLTMILPLEDRTLRTLSQLEDQIAWGLGGRVAEELIFNDVSSGASNDIEKATDLARQMVTRYGMSKKLGPMVLGDREEMIFLGKQIGEHHHYSDTTAYEIDKEVRILVENGYARAWKILAHYRDKLIEIAELLLEKETLEGVEFEQMFEGARPQPQPLPVLSTGAVLTFGG